jgi:hypothetical protein
LIECHWWFKNFSIFIELLGLIDFKSAAVFFKRLRVCRGLICLGTSALGVGN